MVSLHGLRRWLSIALRSWLLHDLAILIHDHTWLLLNVHGLLLNDSRLHRHLNHLLLLSLSCFFLLSSILVASLACPARDADDESNDDSRDADDDQAPYDDCGHHNLCTFLNCFTNSFPNSLAVFITYQCRFVVIHSRVVASVVILPVCRVVVGAVLRPVLVFADKVVEVGRVCADLSVVVVAIAGRDCFATL